MAPAIRAGFAPLTYGGSLVPTTALANYLRPGPTGFVTMNYAAIEAATNYRAFDQASINAVGVPNVNSTVTYPFSLGAGDTGAASGTEEERTAGLYGMVSGILHLDSRNLRYSLGLRWVQTLQNIISPVQHGDPRNGGTVPLKDGGFYPNFFTFVNERRMYDAFLPSANFVYEVADDFQVRASFSRTMTRPNVNSMIDSVNFGDVAVTNATKGNPAAEALLLQQYRSGRRTLYRRRGLYRHRCLPQIHQRLHGHDKLPADLPLSWRNTASPTAP